MLFENTAFSVCWNNSWYSNCFGSDQSDGSPKAYWSGKGNYTVFMCLLNFLVNWLSQSSAGLTMIVAIFINLTWITYSGLYWTGKYPTVKQIFIAYCGMKVVWLCLPRKTSLITCSMSMQLVCKDDFTALLDHWKFIPIEPTFLAHLSWNFA